MHVGGARGGTRARAWALGSISGWLALLATQGVLEEEVRLKVKVCRLRHREQTYGQGWGEEGQGEMNGESSVDAYTLTHINRRPMGIC